MKIIPHNRFSISTMKSKTQVLSALKAHTQAKKGGLSASTHTFQGEVGEDWFQITRIISYQNSFLPVVEGKINETSMGEVDVTVSMRLHFLVVIFMAIWFIGVGAFCINVLLTDNPFELPHLIPFGMLVFGVALVSGGFWFEANKQKALLEKILTGH